MKLTTYGLALLSTFATTTAVHAGNFMLKPEQSELKAEVHASPSHDFTSVAQNFQTNIEMDPTSLEIKSATCHFNFVELDSGKDSRDKKMCHWIEIDSFPGADFILKTIEPTDTPHQYTAIGELTMHGQSKPVSIQLKVSQVNDQVILDGSTSLNYEDWGLPKIRLLFFTVDPVLKPRFHLVGTITPVAAH